MALVLSLRDGDGFETRGRVFVARHLRDDGSFVLVAEDCRSQQPGELLHLFKISCEQSVELVAGVSVSAGRKSKPSMVQAVIEADREILVEKLDERRPRL